MAIGDTFGEIATTLRAGHDVHLENHRGWLLALQEFLARLPTI